METLFSIKRLECSYNNNSTKVLFIEDLTIEKNQLIFLLGASGSGKSTLLETLGMMNNTISGGEVTFSPNHEDIDFAYLWRNGKRKEIADIRKKYFSFIFQNTNLMENFTAYENVCLSRMIKEDKRQIEVVSGVKELMEKIRLPENEVNYGTLAVNLSGGQRQRLAFVRALNANSLILFGDEPTGNLDEANANELFEVIKSKLKDNLTAIVVSHDIDLAVKHADKIILLTKDTDKGFGEVKKENIFSRSFWQNKNAEELGDFKQHIRNLFNPAADHTIKQQEVLKKDSKSNLKNSFRSLFIKKESIALAGKSYINLLILTGILFFTFLAIGFANGSILYLNNKVNNAFVNWITITIPWAKGDAKYINDMKKNLDDPQLKEKYHYENISAHHESPWRIENIQTKDFSVATGRTIDFDRDKKLLSDILNQKIDGKPNYIQGSKTGLKDGKDLGLIVTQTLLSQWHYPEDASYVNIEMPVVDPTTKKDTNLCVPIPIRTVVKELPGNYLLAYNSFLWEAYMTRQENVFDFTRHTDKLSMLVKADSLLVVGIKKSIDEYFNQNNEYAKYKPIKVYPISKHIASYAEGFDIQMSFFNSLPSYHAMDLLYDKLISLNNVKEHKYQIIRTYYNGDVNQNFNDVTVTYDILSVFFTKGDKIRDFQKYLQDNYNDNTNKNDPAVIQIDSSKITEKENFFFLSNITYIISFLVVLFACVSIVLFLFNLLKMHLNKVKMNIGTFMAIGLENAKSRNIYFAIIILFILVSLIFSFALAYEVGEGINNFLVNYFKLEKMDKKYFELMYNNTYYTLLIIVISSLAVSWFTINKILSKSPGDLIYNR